MEQELDGTDLLMYAFRDIAARALAAAVRDVMEEAYLAGIFDGEGSVFQNEGRWRVSVTNGHYRTLERFKERFGGSITERKPTEPHHSMCWNWSGSGHVAHRMAEALLPFLQIKRDQVGRACEAE
uniref:Homing endonuclease LAGLIDADG domain-containing protein n=1 Tax=viral metagenome TaxID=1070528 RepID=A0A6M3M237_9ZZZZ